MGVDLEDDVDIVRDVPIEEPIVLDSLKQRPQLPDLRGSLEVQLEPDMR